MPRSDALLIDVKEDIKDVKSNPPQKADEKGPFLVKAIDEPDMRYMEREQSAPNKYTVTQNSHLCQSLLENMSEILGKKKMYIDDSGVVVFEWTPSLSGDYSVPISITTTHLLQMANLTLPKFIVDPEFVWVCAGCKFKNWLTTDLKSLETQSTKDWEVHKVMASANQRQAVETDNKEYLLFPPDSSIWLTGVEEKMASPEFDYVMRGSPGIFYALIKPEANHAYFVYFPPLIYRALTIFQLPMLDRTIDSSNSEAKSLAVVVQTSEHISVLTIAKTDSKQTTLHVNVFDSGGPATRTVRFLPSAIRALNQTLHVHATSKTIQVSEEDVHCQTWIWYYVYCMWLREESLSQFESRLTDRSPNCRLSIVRRFRELILSFRNKHGLSPIALQLLKMTEQSPNDDLCMYPNAESEENEKNQPSRLLSPPSKVPHFRILDIRKDVTRNNERTYYYTWWRESILNHGFTQAALTHFENKCRSDTQKGKWVGRDGMLLIHVLGSKQSIPGVLVYDNRNDYGSLPPQAEIYITQVCVANDDDYDLYLPRFVSYLSARKVAALRTTVSIDKESTYKSLGFVKDVDAQEATENRSLLHDSTVNGRVLAQFHWDTDTVPMVLFLRRK